MIVCGEETGFDPELTGALPLEYLERLLLQNSQPSHRADKSCLIPAVSGETRGFISK